MKWLACRTLGIDARQFTDVQYHRLMQRLAEHARSDRRLNLLNFVPGAAALALIPVWVMLATRFPFTWRLVFEARSACLF